MSIPHLSLKGEGLEEYWFMVFIGLVVQNICMSYPHIILFMVPMLLIFAGAHYVLYLSLLQVFAIVNPLVKLYLGLALIFLAVSFFLATFIARFSENEITRGYYFISGFWLGLLLNLLLPLLTLSILLWGARLIGFTFPATTLAYVLFAIAFAYSTYGVWNAGHTRVKEVSVTIPNLPDVWKGKKIVQLSDVHLGLVHREAFMKSLVEKTNAVNPEIVVITGDLFDGMDGKLDELVGPLDDIKAPRGTYFVTGNHETYLGLDEAFTAIKKTPVKILNDEVVDVNGLKLIGIHYPLLDENESVVTILDSLKSQYAGKPNVLLYHSPTHIAEIKASGVNLELCGHTHDGQVFPFGYIAKLIYKGYEYGLYEEGNYTLYTTTGAGTWGPMMRTGNTPEIVVITLK